MTTTRVITALALVMASVGLTLVNRSESWPIALAGAALTITSGLVFFRHFWRESDRKRKQELSTQIRVVTELSDLAEQARNATGEAIAGLGRRVDVFSQGVLEYVAQLEMDVERLERLFDKADRAATRNRDDILTQTSGVVGVYSILKPTIPYPPFGGWAIGGDCAQRLVGLVLTSKPGWIVETGSGLSTLLAAQTLEMVGGEGRVLSLEHEKRWLEETEALLTAHGVAHRVTIVHAPLTDTLIGEETLPWYDLTGVDLPERIDLVFVDGPPKSVGPMARYPVLPLLYDRLSDGAILLMDDADRPEERAAIDRWRAEFPEATIRLHSDAKGTVEVVKGKV